MDEWIKRYQRVYSHLSAPPRVREAVSHMRPSPFSGGYIRRVSGVLVAAVLLLALLGCGMAAVLYGGDIQSLFLRRWQALTGQPMSQGQRATLDHLSQEIGLSRTVNGVTVTVDSATVGDDVFYLLVRVEDPQLTKGRSCGFEQFGMTLSPHLNEVGGCGWSTQGVDSEGRPLLLVQQNYAWNDGLDRNASVLEATLTLTDLYQGSGSQQNILAAGCWEFPITLDLSQIPQPISLPDTTATVTDVFSAEQARGTFSNITVTSTGIRYDETFPGGDFPDFIPVLILENGVEIPGAAGTGTRTEEDFTFRCSNQWSIPVNLEEAVAVRFGDTEISIP